MVKDIRVFVENMCQDVLGKFPSSPGMLEMHISTARTMRLYTCWSSQELLSIDSSEIINNDYQDSKRQRYLQTDEPDHLLDKVMRLFLTRKVGTSR